MGVLVQYRIQVPRCQEVFSSQMHTRIHRAPDGDDQRGICAADLFEERLLLMRLAARIDDRIEPHPFRPEDFRPTAPLVGEIQRSGVRVA